MKVTSTGIIDGRIADEYGAKGKDFSPGGMASRSIPFTIHDSPAGTVAYAVIFDDDDAVTACGFTWIHWLLSDLEKTDVKADASRTDKTLIQGITSWHSCAGDLSKQEATAYGGPAPPNFEHRYTLKVYALDRKLGLKNGFMLNELKRAMDDHILAKAQIIGTYSPKTAHSGRGG